MERRGNDSMKTTAPTAAEAAHRRGEPRGRGAGSTAARQRAAMIAQACRSIEAAEAPPRLAELARQAGMSPWHFHRVFKSETGLTPAAYAAACRARRLREELAHRRGTVTEAIYGAGFGSGSRFYEASMQRLGMRPTEFRAGGAGAVIRFAVGQCSLGAVLVARSQRGVCAIMLGDDPEGLVRELQDQVPRAELIGGDARFEALVARVVGGGWLARWGSGGRRVRGWTGRAACGEPHSGSGCGGRVATSRRARPRATRRSRDGAVGRAPRARSRGPAPPIPWRSRSRATGWCAATAARRVIAGGRSASASCCDASARPGPARKTA